MQSAEWRGSHCRVVEVCYKEMRWLGMRKQDRVEVGVCMWWLKLAGCCDLVMAVLQMHQAGAK